jgi:hypothetical protein
MEFEIFTELPATSLLLASGSTVVGQISVGIVVKEARHVSGFVSTGGDHYR